MKILFISLLIFLYQNEIKKIDSTEDMNRILEVVLKDSLTIEYFKVDGYTDSFKLDIEAVGKCPRHPFNIGNPPENVLHYFIDSVKFDNDTKRRKELFRIYAKEIDCEKFQKRIVYPNKLNFYNPNSNIIISYKYFNDSIIHLLFDYKIQYSPAYSQTDWICFYLLKTDSIFKIIYKSWGT